MKLISNINSLPRPDLIRSLLKSHYSKDSVSQATSSHWKFWSNLFQVEISENGDVQKLRGVGFGDYNTNIIVKFFDLASILSHLIFCTNRIGVLRFLKKSFQLGIPITYDTFRQSSIALLLSEALVSRSITAPKILIVGDGFGVLSSLLKLQFPDAQITLIDLGKVLLFQNIFLQSKFTNAKFTYLDSSLSADFNFLSAEEIHNLKIEQKKFDLAINVASMQEMTLDWIKTYFALIRQLLKSGGLFYCCNRESKQLPSGEIISFLNYPWLPGDEIIFNESPIFYKWYFSYRKTKNQLALCGVPIPFGRKFDGPTLHRLVRLGGNK